MQAAVNVAGPFFTPYMLGPLALSYAQFTMLIAAAFLARVAILPFIGRMAQRRGTSVVLWAGAVGIAPIPALWLVSHQFSYLIVLQILAGIAWAALEFATLLSFFERIEPEDRASVLSLFNLGNAAAICLGALVGSQLFAALGAAPLAYAWLFGISTVGRLALLLILRGTRPAGHTLGMGLRTLAVRPSVGAVQRPILASVGPAEGASSQDPSAILP
jgi:MFS family permease